MEALQHDMGTLFDQLGLDSDAAAIGRFIQQHRPLPDDQRLCDAPFWSKAQAQFLREKQLEDAAWVQLIDTLNELLHQPHDVPHGATAVAPDGAQNAAPHAGT